MSRYGEDIKQTREETLAMFTAFKNFLTSIKVARTTRQEANVILAVFATRPREYQNDAELRRDAELIRARLSR